MVRIFLDIHKLMIDRFMIAINNSYRYIDDR